MWKILFFWLIFPSGFQTENVKIWKHSNYFREHATKLGENCGKIEFNKKNSAPIIIDRMKTGKIVLPVSGNLILSDGAVLDLSATGKQECFRVSRLDLHDYLDPDNWKSELSSNPAVPDLEKLPCIYDTIEFPQKVYSGISTTGLSRLDTVDGINIGNSTVSRIVFQFFKSSDLGKAMFFNNERITPLSISSRKCYDNSGCSCRRSKNIQCVPRKTQHECNSPVQPLGFCRKICGAYTLFRPTGTFNLDILRTFLNEENNEDDGIYVHVSKIEEEKIQIVFSELEYDGKSVQTAGKLYETLRKRSKEFGIQNMGKLETSGSKNSGTTVWTLIFLSLAFVCAAYALIFYVFETRGMKIDLGFLFNQQLPMTSSYRARFSTTNDDDDENGLIFDGQSGVDDVIDPDQSQSFDNPLYGKISTGPNIAHVSGGEEEEIEEEKSEKISFSKIAKNHAIIAHGEEEEEKKEEITTTFFTINEDKV